MHKRRLSKAEEEDDAEIIWPTKRQAANAKKPSINSKREMQRMHDSEQSDNENSQDRHGFADKRLMT